MGAFYGGEEEVSHCFAINIFLLRRSPAKAVQFACKFLFIYATSFAQVQLLPKIKAILRIAELLWRRRRDSNS